MRRPLGLPPGVAGLVGVAVGLCVTAFVQAGTVQAYIGLAVALALVGYTVWYVVTHWRRS
jgi:hypothetical protein